LAAGRRLVEAADGLLLLALETAARAPSVALLRGGAPIAEERAPAGSTGAEGLLPCIDAALARAGVGLDAVEAVAVSIGPGSFTGLRVGVATAKGLVFGSQVPVVPVPTLAALAFLAPESETEPVVALLDARRGELYAAGYRLRRPPGSAREAEDCEPLEGVYTPEELAARLPASCRLVGEGVPLCGARLRELCGPGLRLGPDADPRARDVGALGLRRLAGGGGIQAADLVPRYLRRAEAEVKRTGERFE
jgi:tRNA threonylcarbamoyladenosine biosynthesis protein TsaB